MVRSKTEENVKEDNSKDLVSLNFLVEATGFPKDFIKTELLLDSEQIYLDQLRLKMLNYLERLNLGGEEASI